MKKNLEVFIFASSEWDKEQIESFTQKGEESRYPCTFHIINEMDLLVRKMIETHPPYKCKRLNFNKFGVAAHNFNVMILGFGALGQHSLLRLIMNGQFVNDEKKRMNAIVIDREINYLQEHFKHYYPSIELCCDIKFLNFDVRDKVFFDLLKECSNMDYIVVALNGNEENKQIALDIRLHYKRNNMPLPFIAVSEKNEGIHEVSYDNEIFTFGCRDEVYKESVTIREETNRMAEAVNETYRKIYGGEPWHKLDWFTQESNRAVADFIPAMLKLANTDAEKTANEGSFAEDSAIAEVLAQTEHLRWMAFHAVMWYNLISLEEMGRRFESYGGEKYSQKHLDYCRRDMKDKLHSCLVSWDELDSVSETYRRFAHRAGYKKEQNRDFKENDRDVIKNIPKFLSEAKNKK